MSYVIESGIPVPSSRWQSGGAPKSAYRIAIESLEAGQSVLIDVDRRLVSSTCCQVSKKNGKRYTTRNVEGGVRVWCVA